jgi:hypothetical protein
VEGNHQQCCDPPEAVRRRVGRGVRQDQPDAPGSRSRSRAWDSARARAVASAPTGAGEIECGRRVGESAGGGVGKTGREGYGHARLRVIPNQTWAG